MLSFNRLVLSLSILCIFAGILLYEPPLFNLQGRGQAAAVSLNLPSPAAGGRPLSLALQLDKLNCGVAKRVKPTVVAIVARKARRADEETLTRSEKALQQDFGSGFLIDAKGFILTNHHLVEGAQALEVSLADGRSAPGRMVRSDPASDIALLKIELGSLPVAMLGDSNGLEAGQRILAIGHPFGLLQTVSSGIIAALGRSDLSLLPYENFIQTDAAISPGSSGGPLVNLQGEVVGINTAIYSHSGKGNHGISFAVPINLARALAERWIKGGNISRIGIATVYVDRDMADYYKLPAPQGAFISYVENGSPAAEGGLLARDLVLEFGGRRVRDQHDLRLMIAEQVPGQVVKVGVLRAGAEHSFEVVPVESSGPSQPLPPPQEPLAGGSRIFGITVTTLTRELASSNGVPPSKLGVAVIDVDPESAAWRKGVRPGGVILEVNERKIEDIGAFDEAMTSPGDVTMFKILSRGYDERDYFIRRSER
jgi:S1-C subfamily serine protease